MRNPRLAEAISAAGLTFEQVARRLEVDPKTVGRWVNDGVRPSKHNHKRRLAELLDANEDVIWPRADIESPVMEQGESTDEIARAWSHRGAAPKDTWWRLVLQAQHHVDFLAYAMQFLPEDNPSLNKLLIAKASEGCQVRIALADPDSPAVASRDEEEELGGTFPHRIRTTLHHFRRLNGVDGIDLRYHQTPLYNSVFRGDDQMLVTPHMYRLKGYLAPLLELRRRSDDGVFTNYLDHFERVWADSTPIPSP
jgi:hypothetical protein